MMRKRALALALSLLLLCVPSGALAVLQKPYSLTPTADVWNTYDPALHYFYQQLTDAEKRLFSARYDALALGDASLWNYQASALSAFSRARVDYALLWDCPELMFIPLGDVLMYGHIQVPDEAYLQANPDRIQAMNILCKLALIQWKSDALTDIEKEIAVDRYLLRHCRYTVERDATRYSNPNLTDSIRTAYSALVTGRATCEGYAFAVQYAMRYLGVPCIKVNGTYNTKEGLTYGHTWNLVQIDGNWYHYDATWNDRDDNAFLEDYFPYFNLSTIEIRRSHTDETNRAVLEFKLPQCASTRDNYYVLKGQMAGENWRDEIAALLQNAVQAGKGALGVRFTTAEAYQDALSTLLRLGCDAVFPGVDGIAFDSDDFVDFLYFYWP